MNEKIGKALAGLLQKAIQDEDAEYIGGKVVQLNDAARAENDRHLKAIEAFQNERYMLENERDEVIAKFKAFEARVDLEHNRWGRMMRMAQPELTEQEGFKLNDDKVSVTLKNPNASAKSEQPEWAKDLERKIGFDLSGTGETVKH